MPVKMKHLLLRQHQQLAWRTLELSWNSLLSMIAEVSAFHLHLRDPIHVSALVTLERKQPHINAWLLYCTKKFRNCKVAINVYPKLRLLQQFLCRMLRHGPDILRTAGYTLSGSQIWYKPTVNKSQEIISWFLAARQHKNRYKISLDIIHSNAAFTLPLFFRRRLGSTIDHWNGPSWLFTPKKSDSEATQSRRQRE